MSLFNDWNQLRAKPFATYQVSGGMWALKRKAPSLVTANYHL
jgi:hypothetical protein